MKGRFRGLPHVGGGFLVLVALCARASAQDITVSVAANQGPWLVYGPFNTGYSFGDGYQETPTMVGAFSGLDFDPGTQLSVSYVSGLIQNNPSAAGVDANGYSGTIEGIDYYAPGYYVSNPVSATLDGLMGAFTDDFGSIIGTPFLLGDGPTVLTVPSGATQLSMGVDDDTYANKTDPTTREPLGAWTIDVADVPTPEPAALGLIGAAAAGLLARRGRS